MQGKNNEGKNNEEKIECNENVSYSGISYLICQNHPSNTSHGVARSFPEIIIATPLEEENPYEN